MFNTIKKPVYPFRETGFKVSYYSASFFLRAIRTAAPAPARAIPAAAAEPVAGDSLDSDFLAVVSSEAPVVPFSSTIAFAITLPV